MTGNAATPLPARWILWAIVRIVVWLGKLKFTPGAILSTIRVQVYISFVTVQIDTRARL
ncbi:hypothetical protein M405DRAFT_222204 [Rhizopogon salebrosus TDB-379]|nr:hypothetical protein M405DRAFT_222204 [Rhizopogon salebrosus TDB-379]